MIPISEHITNAELATRTLKGTTWVFSARLLQQGLNFLQLVILARLLEPHDFGLMAIALVATNLFSAFTYTGYELALVQKPNLNSTDLHTAWWIMLGRRALIGAALILFAIPISKFYKTPEVIPILMAVGGLQALQGLTSPALSLWQKRFEFGKYFNYQVLPALFGLLLGTVAAFLLRNVWALVISMFTATAAQVFLSYFLDPYRPAFCIDRKSFSFSFRVWEMDARIRTSLFLFITGHSRLRRMDVRRSSSRCISDRKQVCIISDFSIQRSDISERFSRVLVNSRRYRACEQRISLCVKFVVPGGFLCYFNYRTRTARSIYYRHRG